jgi:hypothetical protein
VLSLGAKSAVCLPYAEGDQAALLSQTILTGMLLPGYQRKSGKTGEREGGPGG